jgi:hypothetical protein
MRSVVAGLCAVALLSCGMDRSADVAGDAPRASPKPAPAAKSAASAVAPAPPRTPEAGTAVAEPPGSRSACEAEGLADVSIGTCKALLEDMVYLGSDVVVLSTARARDIGGFHRVRAVRCAVTVRRGGQVPVQLAAKDEDDDWDAATVPAGWPSAEDLGGPPDRTVCVAAGDHAVVIPVDGLAALDGDIAPGWTALAIGGKAFRWLASPVPEDDSVTLDEAYADVWAGKGPKADPPKPPACPAIPEAIVTLRNCEARYLDESAARERHPHLESEALVLSEHETLQSIRCRMDVWSEGRLTVRATSVRTGADAGPSGPPYDWPDVRDLRPAPVAAYCLSKKDHALVIDVRSLHDDLAALDGWIAIAVGGQVLRWSAWATH